MFKLGELSKTRYYQDVKRKGKLETIPKLLQEGLSVEQIARALELPLEVVQKEAQKFQQDSGGN